MRTTINGKQLMNLVLLKDYGIHRCNLTSVKALERRGLVKLQEGGSSWGYTLTPSGVNTIELHRPMIYGTGYRFSAKYPIALDQNFKVEGGSND